MGKRTKKPNRVQALGDRSVEDARRALERRAAERAFERAIRRVAEVLETRVHELDDLLGARRLSIPGGREDRVELLRAKLADAGALLLGDGRIDNDGVHLFLLPTADPFEALAAFGFARPDPDLDGRSVVDYLRRLHAAQPFVLTDLSNDVIGGRFTDLVADPTGVAELFAHICPDVVEQSFDSVESLAAALEEQPHFYLWWD